ncbi:DNA-binding protein [Lactococcus hircilactis]|uniref:DNA-binding protein n=1 Tax=Lactococcus hircilactis TaxID=1494462 RepID=A0A7X1Z9W6_9LACT|nr:zinc ribbon domain-containing protein [Lactococcus hircilactis]MQW39392.1 DNA-binding protein [Lactococcus hircilactis]
MNGYERQYSCIKCGNHHFEQDHFQSTGGEFSKLFNVQHKKFITISCAQCGFTELYKSKTSSGMNVLDFLMNEKH